LTSDCHGSKSLTIYTVLAKIRFLILILMKIFNKSVNFNENISITFIQKIKFGLNLKRNNIVQFFSLKKY